MGGLARWMPLKLSDFISQNARRLLRLYQLIGWFILYASTAFALWGLKLYSFRQEPLRELLASIVLLLWLLALMLFRKAFRPRMKSPLSAIFDAVAGILVTIALLAGLYLWAEAASKRDLAHQLQRVYAVSLGKWHFLGSKPFVFDAPKPLPAKKNGPPQKAVRRTS
jgi:hypothetical protein